MVKKIPAEVRPDAHAHAHHVHMSMRRALFVFRSGSVQVGYHSRSANCVSQVIKNAKGLAIFTTMRTGLWFSGAGGSGILVGRKEDGNWSPPSGIMLHTAGLGFLVGVDIYDCVVVINTQEALDAFATIRCTLGGEISAVAGPVGVGGVLETEVHKRQAPVFNYLKSRGFYAGVQIDGTIIIERTDENERFYGQKIGVKDILAGKTMITPREIRPLLETIKAAQGDADVDASLLPDEPPPADFEIENNQQLFGVPDKEDPDPFGVLALEQAGLEIREAGTHKRPPSEQFEFKPSPTSPIYTTFRHSMDRSSMDRSRRSSWRTSTISSVLESNRGSTMVDSETQTDLESTPTTPEPPTLPTRPSHNGSPTIPTMADIPEDKSTDEINLPPAHAQEETKNGAQGDKGNNSPKEAKPKDSLSKGATPEISVSTEEDATAKKPQVAESPDFSHDDEKSATARLRENRKSRLRPVSEARKSMAIGNDGSEDDYDYDDDDVEEEEPVIQEFLQATAPQAINRARIVTVAKPIPPKLPMRSPLRARNSVHSDTSSEYEHRDAACGPSPVQAPSIPQTPSLKNDGSSTSSRESISSMEGFEKTVSQLDIKPTHDLAQKEAADLHSTSSSPKAIPGGFH